MTDSLRKSLFLVSRNVENGIKYLIAADSVEQVIEHYGLTIGKHIVKPLSYDDLFKLTGWKASDLVHGDKLACFPLLVDTDREYIGFWII